MLKDRKTHHLLWVVIANVVMCVRVSFKAI